MKKILIIEDNLEVRENTAEILELSNYKVLTAENGKVSVELALKELPELIVFDIIMPVLDGYGVYHLLSKHKETAATPFIFLTAKSEKSDFRRGMEMGVDDYITKPFYGIELLNAIEVRLKKSDLLKQQYSGPEALNEFIANAQQTSKVQLTSDEREVYTYNKKHILYKEGQRPQSFIKIITKNIAAKEESLLDLAYNSLRKKAAFGLIQLYDKYKLPETQSIGIATETLIRTLSDFKDEKLIDIQSGKVTVLNEQKLMNLPY